MAGKFTSIPQTAPATGPVAGLRGTGGWSADERPTNFREYILWRNPNGTAPLTALMSKMGKESTDDPEFHWWDEPNDLMVLQVNGALIAGDLTVVVTGLDPTYANPSRNYGSALHLKAGDLLLCELAAEDASILNHEIIQVTGVTNGTTFAVDRGVAGTTPAAIPDGSRLLLMGSAYGEGSAAATATSRNPIKYTNYCQIFKTSYEITKTALKTYARTGKVESNDKKRKVFDHSRQLELAMMFGQAYEDLDAAGQPIRFMGGLREFIPQSNTNVFTAAVDVDAYMAALAPVFDYDTPAGDERIIFCGNGYLNTLNAIAQKENGIRFGPVIKQYGMNLREFILPQGRVFLKTHPLMNRHPGFTYSGFIIDASALKYRYLRDTMSEDNIQENGADKKKGQWLTEASLEVRYGGLTLGYHGNMSAAA